MSDSTTARAKILASIRSAYPQTRIRSAVEMKGPRNYERTGTLDARTRLDLFVERLRDYDANVLLTSLDALQESIAGRLTAQRCRSMLIPADSPKEWLPEDFVFMRDIGLTPKEMDLSDGVLTGCTVAIARTGTLVLQNGPIQGRRALSLMPDYHLCVVFQRQIVETVPEAFDCLQAQTTLPTTFISGPSATADIEMTRIRGVHGPRRLDVIVVA